MFFFLLKRRAETYQRRKFLAFTRKQYNTFFKKTPDVKYLAKKIKVVAYNNKSIWASTFCLYFLKIVFRPEFHIDVCKNVIFNL